MTRRRVILLALLAALTVFAPPAASAAPARIAFDGDGSIFTMDADGSDRSELTHGTPTVRDYAPRWSPDGSTIAFARHTGHGLEFWAMEADGTSPRRLLKGDVYGAGIVGFTPQGEVLIERFLDGTGIALFAVDPDTGSKRRLRHEHLYYDLAVSPDGKWYTGGRHRLIVARADGSRRRELTPDVAQPRWSPDGKRIAFVSEKDRNGKWCEFEGPCDISGEIYVIDRDGSNLRRLTRSKADDRAPSWSADGRRIAFESDRNYPQHYNTEIYSIRADGRCLTWLTNGSIWSGTPDWRPGAGNTSPGACGAAGREPTVDLDLSRLERFDFPLYWFGPVVGGRMILSDLYTAQDGMSMLWDDCGYYRPERCGRGAGLGNDRSCLWVDDLLDRGNGANLSLRRGALLSNPAPPPWAAPEDLVLYAGRTVVELNRVRDVRRLRLYPNEKPAAGDLPEAAFPEWFYRQLRRAERSYARTHSEKATAEELGLSRKQVRSRLSVARKLRELGVDGRQECAAPRAAG